MRGEDVKVGPGVVIPKDGKKPCIEDFIRHIGKHCFSFLYMVHISFDVVDRSAAFNALLANEYEGYSLKNTV